MDLETGNVDLSILDENLQKINDLSKPEDKKIVIIKSTVVPGTTRAFAEKYTNLNFSMNPEFLTARNNRLDFICASRIIIGEDKDTWVGDKLEEMYRYRFGNSTPIYRCILEEAELTKYGANCFFAVKISYFNTMYKICEKLGLNFDNVRDMILSDGRIARSHANVPGWDGKLGYSGACFPKDINALMHFTKSIGVNSGLLEASWKQNLEDRPDKDWEDIPSAVSKKETK
jgi:UDPglucose 6-dehydrogenase